MTTDESAKKILIEAEYEMEVAAKEDEENLLECGTHGDLPHFIKAGETFYWVLWNSDSYDMVICADCFKSKALEASSSLERLRAEAETLRNATKQIEDNLEPEVFEDPNDEIPTAIRTIGNVASFLEASPARAKESVER